MTTTETTKVRTIEDLTPAELAANYARKGVPVMPCNAQKRPLTAHGLKDAVSDPEQVAAWWRQHPDALVGMPTGLTSGFVVIDLDTHDGKDGAAEFKKLRAGREIKTAAVRTPSGGYHLYFNAPSVPVKSTANKIAPGVDSRGEGGYVIAAGSALPDGRRYAQIGNAKPADMPEWLIDLLKTKGVTKTNDAPVTNPAKAQTAPAQPVAAEEVKIKSALAAIDPDHDRDSWRNVGMALKSWDETNGFLLWDEWSARGQKYDEGVLQGQWDSFSPSGGITLGTLYHAAKQAGWKGMSGEERTAYETAGGTGQNSLPAVSLPDNSAAVHVRVVDAAARLGDLIAKDGGVFIRDGTPVAVRDGRLVDVGNEEFPGIFEQVAWLVSSRATKQGDVKIVPRSATKNQCEVIVACREFREKLPPIRLVSQCPVVTGTPLRVVTGYDRDSGIYVAGGGAVEVSIAEAVPMLTRLLSDFDFVTESDRSRAIAAMLTPGLVHGGLLGGRPPVDLGEANESQSGKGYRNKITAAIYGVRLAVVTQKTGGVGSMEEGIQTALLEGASMVCVDNIRGRLDSQWLEAALTEDRIGARAPHRAEAQVDMTRVVMMMTSNSMTATVDLSKRASVVRIKKRPADYQYHSWNEGDVVAHVRANQPRYLGAVFSVIQAWDAAGRPRIADGRHDRREWSGALNWIVQNVFAAAPLLDGLQDAQRRMATPHLAWMRDVAIAVIQAGRVGEELQTSDLIDVIHDAGIEVPGAKGEDLSDDTVRMAAMKGTGKRLCACFGATSDVEIDGMKATRVGYQDDEGRPRKKYIFRAQKPSAGDIGGIYGATSGETMEYAVQQAGGVATGGRRDEIPDVGADSPDVAPMSAHRKSPMFPMSPMSDASIPPAFVDGGTAAAGCVCVESNAGDIGTYGKKPVVRATHDAESDGLFQSPSRKADSFADQKMQTIEEFSARWAAMIADLPGPSPTTAPPPGLKAGGVAPSAVNVVEEQEAAVAQAVRTLRDVVAEQGFYSLSYVPVFGGDETNVWPIPAEECFVGAASAS